MKKVPNLRFKEFSGEWEQTTLGKVTNGFEYGMNAAATEFDGENKYIRITDIDEITNKYLDNDVVSPSGILEDKYLVNDNDILFARTGASTGKTYLYNKEDGRLYFAGFLIRSNVNSLNNSKFIFLQTQNQEYKKWVKVTSMRSGQPGINSQEYASYSFYSPKLGEQEKIAAFFSLIDKKIALQTEKVEELKNYKKGLMQKIFSQELRFKDENGNEYPEWEEKTLGYFLSESKIKGDTGDRAKKLTVKLWAKGIVEKRDDIQGSAETQYYIRKAGQLMYGKLDFLNCAFGIVPKELDGFQSTLDAPAFDVRNANSIFLLNRIIQKDFYKKNGDIADGSRKAKRIHVDTFLNMKLFMPTLEEQNKIASFFSLIDKKLELEMEKLEQLQEYKKGLLQQMFI
ncbi:MAG: restriction endonuclease subunit S [Turicibacter sp.]|nr:restriction endonuclease subunit S [Turicibacter sp.]